MTKEVIMLTAEQTMELFMHSDRLTRKLADRVNGGDFTPMDMLVLWLVRDGYSRPSDLSVVLDRPHPTVSHIITNLTTHGFITRERHDADGRGRVLSITPVGEKALQRVLAVMSPPEHRAFGPHLLAKVRTAADKA